MDFEKAINEFLDFLIALEIKTKSSKLHILFCHVKEFCRKNGYGLGAYSEQAAEIFIQDSVSFPDINSQVISTKKHTKKIYFVLFF